MEDTVFPSPAVAELMQKELVEARLHTDTQNTLTDAQFAENRRLQAELAGSKANPYFVIVDPHTGKVLKKGGLSGGYTEWPAVWTKFVNDAVAKRR